MQTALEAANEDLAKFLEAAWESWLRTAKMEFDSESVLLFCRAMDDLVPSLKGHLFNTYFEGLIADADEDDRAMFPAGLMR
jgi:hypothetical protein